MTALRKFYEEESYSEPDMEGGSESYEEIDPKYYGILKGCLDKDLERTMKKHPLILAKQ